MEGSALESRGLFRGRRSHVSCVLHQWRYVQGAKALAEGLRACVGLNCLSLLGNGIGWDEEAVLRENLPQCHKLTL